MSMESHGGIVLTGETVSPTRTLWKSFQQSHLVANQEKLAEANDEFSLRRIFFVLLCDILHVVKFYDMGPPALLPSYSPDDGGSTHL
jgi:hypothetical protein